MSITTYSELKQAVSNWLIHEDVPANASTFIQLAESDIRRRLRIRRMQERMKMTTVAGQDFYPLPNDFLKVARFRIFDTTGGGVKTRKLKYLSPQAIESVYYENYKDTENLTGVPEHFTIIGNQVQFLPVPNDSYVTHMTFYEKVPYLSDGNQSNIFLEDYPDLLLYGALMHGTPFLREDARAVNFATYYEAQINEINEVDKIDIMGDEGPDVEADSVGIQSSSLYDINGGL